MISFLTSKIGILEKTSIFSYLLTDDVIKLPEQLEKFKRWLIKSDEIKLYEITENGFRTFQAMKEESTWQYTFKSSIEIFPPFENIQRISSYMAFLIRDSFSKQYVRFLRDNTFVTDQIELPPFILKKCIEFNVELFESGKLFIHFLPVTKITSPEKISQDYINKLKHSFSLHYDDINVFLVEQKHFRRLKIDLFSKDDMEKSRQFIEKNEDIICTFNYHFIASYSPDTFGKVVKETIKDIDKSIFYLKENLDKIKFDEDFNFQDKPFARIAHSSLGEEKNLLIGENKCVNKQSGAYYSGMFQPANNAVLQPVLVDNFKEFDFSDLIQKFNKSCESFELLLPIRVQSTNELKFADVIKRKKELNGKRYLVAIFTEFQQPNDFILPLKKSRTSYQIYLGNIDKFKLSNFTVKCLEKLGGHLSIINDSQECDDTYFIGIDLGHSTNENGRFSNLAFVFFDKQGWFLHSFVNKNLPRNEAISSEVICSSFASFRKYLKSKNKPYPEKLIIHRDGKLHQEDITSIVKQSKKQLSVENVDVVEIIKHGFPVFACFDEGAYINLESGDYFMQNEYAILITNIQANEKNGIVNPIIIKHKIGNTAMKIIVRQVYWFTRIYTNNLYNSTRLPATTLKANNIVGTSLKSHQATYKG